MNRAILIYHTAVLDPKFVFVMVMYGVMSAIVGFLAHMLISKIRKEFHAKAEVRQVRAAVDAFNRSRLSDHEAAIESTLKAASYDEFKRGYRSFHP